MSLQEYIVIKVATKGLLKALVSEDAPSLFPTCFLSCCLGSESACPPTGREGLLYPTGLPNGQASAQVCLSLALYLSPFHFPPPCFHAAWSTVYCSEYCVLASCCLLKNDLDFVACVFLILHLALSCTRDVGITDLQLLSNLF